MPDAESPPATQQPSPSGDKFAAPDEAECAGLRAAEVFKPTTPINRRHLFAGRLEQVRLVHDAVLQIGQHVAIFGERGVGKTSLSNILRPLFEQLGRPRLVVKVNATTKDNFGSLWNKALVETSWSEPAETPGYKPQAVSVPTNLSVHCGVSEDPTPDDVRRCLAQVPDSVWIFDEFDRLQREHARVFTDLIKMLSDYEVPVTLVLVGVAETVELLVRDHKSISRAIVQVSMPRMTPEESRQILTLAADALHMRFMDEAAHQNVHMSQGLPHYTHWIGLHAVRAACDRLSRVIEPQDVLAGLRQAVAKSDETITAKYLRATHSSHKDAIYRQVVLACALARTDEHGWFQAKSVLQPLRNILNREKVEISTFSRHISELCRKDRGAVLEVVGGERRRRYRFRDPLLPPYALMACLKDGLIDSASLLAILREQLPAC